MSNVKVLMSNKFPMDFGFIYHLDFVIWIFNIMILPHLHLFFQLCYYKRYTYGRSIKRQTTCYCSMDV